ncbi:MAG: ATP-binding protein, partial [Myxococcota bacterium]
MTAAALDERHDVRNTSHMPESIRPFVGREAELEALSASVDDATRGFGSLWFIGGEAGIGKSRLVEEVARRAVDRGVGGLWGHCWEAGGAPAYWPWVQVLRQLLRGRDATEVGALLEGRASHLLQLLPELSKAVPEVPRPPELAPEQARFQLFEAVVGVLCDAAVSRPRMVLLEDLHAADPSSVLLLEMLAGPIRGTPLVVVGTFRDAEAQRASVGPMLGRLARQARTIVLTRLERSEVATYLGRTPGARDDAVVDAVHRTTEGHPLFLVELARLLGQGSDVGRLDPGAVALPHTVSGAIQERLDRLSPRARRLLDTASVVGREFSGEIVCAATPEPCAAPERALGECVDTGVLHPVGAGRHRFTHILIREALYRGLSDEQRRALHLRVADVLERSLGASGEVGWSELAHHYLAAGPRGREGGIHAATRAAEHAMAQLAFDEAAEAYARALAALDEDAEARPVRRFELLLGLGSAHLRRGYVQDGKAACREAAAVARRLGDPELLAQAALEHGSVFVYATVDPDLVALLEEARAALGEQESGLRARVLARLASAMQPAPDPTVPFALAREGIALARRAGDDVTLLATLRDGVSALMDMADARERVELNREHVQLAERLSALPAAFRGNLRLVFDCIELGDVAGVRAAMEACARIAAAIDHPHYGWHVAALRAMAAIREGRWGEADAQTAEARALAERSRDPNAPGSLLLQHANRLQLQGRHEEVVALLPRVEAVYARMA